MLLKQGCEVRTGWQDEVDGTSMLKVLALHCLLITSLIVPNLLMDTNSSKPLSSELASIDVGSAVALCFPRKSQA